MQTLSDLIRQPTASERRAFAAVTSTPLSLTAAELKLISQALSLRASQCERMSEKLTALADEMPHKAGMYLNMANEQCIDACDSLELLQKLSKLGAAR